MTVWNWNAKPEECIYMDFETQSLVNIRTEGGRKYIADPSTRVSIAAFVQGERRTVWVVPNRVPVGYVVPYGWDLHTGETPPDWVLDPAYTLVAHNAAEFDALVWEKCVGVPVRWSDSMHLCRAAGLPGGLDKACFAAFGARKDPHGYALINLLCVAKVIGGQVTYPMATPHAWSMFIEYCCTDVLLLSQLYPLVFPYAEPEALAVHEAINARGIPIDQRFAMRLVMLQEELRAKKGEEFAELSGIESCDARSVKVVSEWLRQIGVQIPEKDGKPTLDRAVLKRVFKEPESVGDDPLEQAIAALYARMEMTRATAGKAIAALKNSDPDGYARGQHVYYGAHTGRFSARGFQPHNFIRGVGSLDMELACTPDLTLTEVEALACYNKCTASDIIATLLRPIVAAPYVTVADFGQVEARGIAWIADDMDALSEFEKWDSDPYIIIASTIFGRPITKADKLERQIGKVVELGCGYGMGRVKLAAYCAAQGLDLAAIGVDPAKCIEVYRSQHAPIKNCWKLLENAVHQAVQGQPGAVCKCEFYTNAGGHLHIRLPSGRPLVYRNARIVMEVPGYSTPERPCQPIPTVKFDHPRGYAGTLYGGRIAENIVQAICRDLLVSALVRLEQHELSPCMHAHDESVCLSDRLDDVCRIQSTPPKWAEGFPLMVEGHTWRRYTKSPPKSAPRRIAMNGEVR